MDISNHDLIELDEERLLNLSEDELRRLSVKLLNDLKEARERLEQNSRNSSRPPSSELPWNKHQNQQDDHDESEEPPDSADEKRDKPVLPKDADDQTQSASIDRRKPGKQPGAQGFGREQQLSVTHQQDHIPTICSCCGATLETDKQTAWTAFDTVDVEWADEQSPGIRVTNTRHTYYEIPCRCGHVTSQQPHRPENQATLPETHCGEWRLVGPGLASLIICLAYRMRLSRQRIQEFLHDWLGLQLSVGTIHNTLHESGAAALPLEEALVQEVVESQLLHVDETSWMELTTLLWLWVFSTDTVTVYWIAYRSGELIKNILGQAYCGWLMSHGYRVYRQYPNRLRCWAHLIRKAKGLEESLDHQARQLGKETLALFGSLIIAIRHAREYPPDTPLPDAWNAELTTYRESCERIAATATHKKTRKLANEMLNDWQAIFQVLHHPHLPITNNEAERALRHWVILRRISYGTRT